MTTTTSKRSRKSRRASADHQLALTLFDGNEIDTLPAAACDEHGRVTSYAPPVWTVAMFKTALLLMARSASGREKGSRGYWIGCRLAPATDQTLATINAKRQQKGQRPLNKRSSAIALERGHRSNPHVASVEMIGVDYDEFPAEQPDLSPEAWPWLAIWHTSHNWSADTAPCKYRVALPLKEPISLADYKARKDALQGMLPRGAILRAPHQPAYWPTCPAGGEVRVGVVPGERLDWSQLPERAEQSQPRQALPAAPTAAVQITDAWVAHMLEHLPAEGARHNALLPLAGALRQRGVTKADALDCIRALARAFNPKHALNRHDNVVLDTYAEPEEAQITGAPTLLELCGFGETPGARMQGRLWLERGWELLGIRQRPADEQRTDLGNARRLVRLHGADLRYFTARGVWYVWDSQRWAADDTDQITRHAKAAAESLWEDAKSQPDDDKRKAAFLWAAACQDRSRINNMIALAASEPDVPVRVDDLDADPYLLNVGNGTLDLRTAELRPPDRNQLMTKVAAAEFVAGAKSKLWNRVLADLFGSDVELCSYVQRAMGYALLGEWREKAFWFGYGPPDGGKSTFLGAVAHALGDYAVSADAATWMVQHNNGGNRGDLVRLLGARLVTTVEVRAGARFDQALMKKVTGGDPLVAAAKYEGEIQWKPTFALWFGANDRPVIPDDDEGFWNRVRCVPFTRVVAKDKQDKALGSKLREHEHMRAIMAWLVQGCLAYLNDGLGTCDAVEQATAKYRQDMSQAAGFFEDRCEFKAGAEVSAGDLRTAYESWCLTNGVRRPLRPKDLAVRLQERGATEGRRGKSRTRTWCGVRLMTEDQ